MTMQAPARKVGVASVRPTACRVRAGSGRTGRGPPAGDVVSRWQAGVPPEPLAPSRSRSGIGAIYIKQKPRKARYRIVSRELLIVIPGWSAEVLPAGIALIIHSVDVYSTPFNYTPNYHPGGRNIVTGGESSGQGMVFSPGQHPGQRPGG